ncbi:hypothetical protein ACOSQ2_007117 [Xanthoceras sorbifolium]
MWFKPLMASEREYFGSSRMLNRNLGDRRQLACLHVNVNFNESKHGWTSFQTKNPNISISLTPNPHTHAAALHRPVDRPRSSPLTLLPRPVGTCG